MHCPKFVTLMRLVLVLAALSWGTCLASAQMMKSGGKTKQTGPYRSAQTIMQMRQTTPKQRVAAAQRNAARKAAAGVKNQVGLNAQKGSRK